MDWIELSLQRFGAALSRMLDPAALALDRLLLLVRTDLDGFGVSYVAQTRIIAAVCAVILLMLVRTLSGWWRVILILLVAVLLAKVYGLLPGG